MHQEPHKDYIEFGFLFGGGFFFVFKSYFISALVLRIEAEIACQMKKPQGGGGRVNGLATQPCIQPQQTLQQRAPEPLWRLHL